MLTEDPFIPQAFGSYSVFRKLEQDVKGFKQAEAKLATELGLQGEFWERAGAMLVGRFEDGTPVQLDDEEGLINNAVLNNFDYETDKASKRPFHAHIRKVNPRSGLLNGGMAAAKEHIMARRGITYGTRDDNPNDGQVYNKPEGGVGLLFMSYQASIKSNELIEKSGLIARINRMRLILKVPASRLALILLLGREMAHAWGIRYHLGRG